MAVPGNPAPARTSNYHAAKDALERAEVADERYLIWFALAKAAVLALLAIADAIRHGDDLPNVRRTDRG